MTSILERKLLVVTGKGGTGKTVVAASLAKAAVASGKRVLLCELDRDGDIASAFSSGADNDAAPEFQPKEVESGLFLMRMDTEAALSEYLRLNVKLPLVLRLGTFARAFDFVATAAPGVKEVLTMGKLCWEVKRESYDLVIADAPASGHVVSQLESPRAIGGLVTAGPIDRQTTWMREMLSDPSRTGTVVVTTPDEVPIRETVELVRRLTTETKTPIACIVVNRTVPELFLREDEAVFDEMCTETGLQRLAAVPGDVRGVLEMARFGNALRRTQAHHLDELLAEVHFPTVFLPQCFESLETRFVVDVLSRAVAQEIDI